MVAAPIAAFLGDPLDGGRAASAPSWAEAQAEDGGRRLFCFAMQSAPPGSPSRLRDGVGFGGRGGK